MAWFRIANFLSILFSGVWWWACLPVCPHSCLRTIRPIFSFYMHVALSLSDGVATCYVLPVLWMTSCLHIGLMASKKAPSPIRRRIRGTRSRKGVYSKWLTRWQHIYDVAVYTHTDAPLGRNGPGAESGVYDCLVQSALSCWFDFLSDNVMFDVIPWKRPGPLLYRVGQKGKLLYCDRYFKGYRQ